MSDISYRPVEFAKCPFDFSVERTNVQLLSCQRSHHLFFFFFVTLGHCIADPVTGCSLSIRAYILLKHSQSHLFLDSFTQCLHGNDLRCHIG